MENTNESSPSGGHPKKIDFDLSATDILTVHGHREAVKAGSTLQMIISYPWQDDGDHDAKEREATIIAKLVPVDKNKPSDVGAWPPKQPTWKFEVPRDYPSSDLYDGSTQIPWTAPGTSKNDARPYDIRAEANGVQKHIYIDLCLIDPHDRVVELKEVSQGFLDFNKQFFGHYKLEATSGSGEVHRVTENQEMYNSPLVGKGFYCYGGKEYKSELKASARDLDLGNSFANWIVKGSLASVEMKTLGSIGWTLSKLKYDIGVNPDDPGPWSGSITAKAEAGISFGGMHKLDIPMFLGNKEIKDNSIKEVFIAGTVNFAVKGVFSYDAKSKQAHLEIKVPEVKGNAAIYYNFNGAPNQLGPALKLNEIKIPKVTEGFEFTQDFEYPLLN